jgi:hypothetical protein
MSRIQDEYSIKTKQYYKFLNLKDNKITSEHGKQAWLIGKEYSVTGQIIKCKNGFHASVEPLDALRYVQGDVLALVTTSGESDNDTDTDTDKVCYRSMTIVKAYNWTKLDSVALAIYSAELVIKIYEDKYPNDSRPRDAIKAAKAYLKIRNMRVLLRMLRMLRMLRVLLRMRMLLRMLLLLRVLLRMRMLLRMLLLLRVLLRMRMLRMLRMLRVLLRMRMLLRMLK